MTRKRARQLSKARRKPPLPTLLKIHKIHEWLHPFVLDVHDVEADGHCGFRAIAVCIGQSEDEWPYIRQQLECTLEKNPDMFNDRTLHDTRSDTFRRLRTREPEVLSQQELWLTIPSLGGLIATTFDRPVLYYEPGTNSQISFPYLTPINNNAPIVLAWANRHFVSLELDTDNPDLPVPSVCATWRRFRVPDAASWLDMWNNRVQSHAMFLKARNKHRNKKKPLEW